MLLAAISFASVVAPTLDVWYGPTPFSLHTWPIRADFFGNVTAPATAWPKLADETAFFKLFIDTLIPLHSSTLPNAPGTTDAQLSALISTLQAKGLRTGIEVGGARWGAGRCDAAAALAFASHEQGLVERWMNLGGTVDSITTDHADVWNIRGDKGAPCVPAVPMATRIDVVAQVFASWRTFLGDGVSFGFIESLGFWEIEGPSGTQFTTTDPAHLGPGKLPGWIPKLDDVTTLLLAAGAKHKPRDSEVPLIDHYFIDFGAEGVAYDTLQYGRVPPLASGANYNRILGAEAIMHRHGLATGVFLNAFPAKSLNCSSLSLAASNGCSASAALSTLNFTRGYVALPNRRSQHAVLEQWQHFPSATGPASAHFSGMWMASECAAVVVAANAIEARARSVPCTGASAALAPAQCAAWQSFFDGAFGAATGCTTSRNDPCGACSQGVRCNGTNIEDITLGEINLRGTIPPSLSALSGLQVLELGFNHFSGTIPSSIEQLRELRMFIVANNSLTGEVPNLQWDQFKILHGSCALGGSGNAYCAPLPAGAGSCAESWGLPSTHACPPPRGLAAARRVDPTVALGADAYSLL